MYNNLILLKNFAFGIFFRYGGCIFYKIYFDNSVNLSVDVMAAEI
jgi:hypothetical protein